MYHCPPPPPAPCIPRDRTQPEPAREAAAQDSPQDIFLQMGGLKPDLVPGPMTDSEFPFYVSSPAPCLYAPHCLLMAGLCLGGSRFSNQTQGSGHSAPGQGCIGRSAHGWDLGSVQGSLWASPALSGPCFWRPLRSQSAQGFTDPCWLRGAPAFHQGRWSGLTTS